MNSHRMGNKNNISRARRAARRPRPCINARAGLSAEGRRVPCSDKRIDGRESRRRRSTGSPVGDPQCSVLPRQALSVACVSQGLPRPEIAAALVLHNSGKLPALTAGYAAHAGLSALRVC